MFESTCIFYTIYCSIPAPAKIDESQDRFHGISNANSALVLLRMLIFCLRDIAWMVPEPYMITAPVWLLKLGWTANVGPPCTIWQPGNCQPPTPPCYHGYRCNNRGAVSIVFCWAPNLRAKHSDGRVQNWALHIDTRTDSTLATIVWNSSFRSCSLRGSSSLIVRRFLAGDIILAKHLSTMFKT